MTCLAFETGLLPAADFRGVAFTARAGLAFTTFFLAGAFFVLAAFVLAADLADVVACFRVLADTTFLPFAEIFPGL